MQVTRIATTDALQQCSADWNCLTRGVPFRSWEWLSTWGEHYGADRELYVKILVDEGTDPGEVEMGVRLVGSIREGIPVFLQPITDPEHGRLGIGSSTLERFYRRVAGLGVEIRVVPQVHKVLGVP